MGSVGKQTTLSYPKLPYATLWKGMATKEEKAEANKIIKDFIVNAKAGDVYKLNNGVGSQGGQIEIVNSSKGLKIKGLGGQPVLLSPANARKALTNGATLIYRKEK